VDSARQALQNKGWTDFSLTDWRWRNFLVIGSCFWGNVRLVGLLVNLLLAPFKSFSVNAKLKCRKVVQTHSCRASAVHKFIANLQIASLVKKNIKILVLR